MYTKIQGINEISCKELHVFLIYVFNMKKFPNKTEEQASQAAAHKCQASLMWQGRSKAKAGG